MLHSYSTDRLVAGAVVGIILTATLVVLFIWLDIPQEKQFDLAIRLATPLVISAFALLCRPLLLKTVLHSRRDIMMLDKDLNHLIVGRALGVVVGALFGVTLATQLL